MSVSQLKSGRIDTTLCGKGNSVYDGHRIKKVGLCEERKLMFLVPSEHKVRFENLESL